MLRASYKSPWPGGYQSPLSSVALLGHGNKDSLLTRGNLDWLNVMISMLSVRAMVTQTYSRKPKPTPTISVLLNDSRRVLIGVEGIHEDEWHIDLVMRVEVLDLADAEIQEGHSLSDFNDRLWADASHSSTETTVKLEYCKLAQDT